MAKQQRSRIKSAFLAMIYTGVTSGLLAWSTYPRPKQSFTVEQMPPDVGWQLDANDDWLVFTDHLAWQRTSLSQIGGVVEPSDHSTQFHFIDRRSQNTHLYTIPKPCQQRGFTIDGRYFMVGQTSKEGDCVFYYYDPKLREASQRKIKLWDIDPKQNEKPNGSAPSEAMIRRHVGFAQDANILFTAASDRTAGLTVRFIDLNTVNVLSEMTFPERTGYLPNNHKNCGAEHSLATRGMAISPDGELFAIAPAWKGNQRTTEKGIDVYSTQTGKRVFRVTDFGLQTPTNSDKDPTQTKRHFGVHFVGFSLDSSELIFTVTPRLRRSARSIWTEMSLVKGDIWRELALLGSTSQNDLRLPDIWYEPRPQPFDLQNDPRLFYSIRDQKVRKPDVDGQSHSPVLALADSWVVLENQPAIFFLETDQSSRLLVVDKDGNTIHPWHEFETTHGNLQRVGATMTMHSKTALSRLGRIIEYTQPIHKYLPFNIPVPKRKQVIVFYDWHTRQTTTLTSDKPVSLNVRNDELFVDYRPTLRTGLKPNPKEKWIEVWSVPPLRWPLGWITLLSVAVFVVSFRRLRRMPAAPVVATSA